MACTWQEEQAYRFVDGSLEPIVLRSYADHLSGCDVCRARVARAERLEGLLVGALTPVFPPPALAGRIAHAVAKERESRPRFAWPVAFGRRFATVAAALLLVAGLVTIAVGPASVVAVVQRALLFVPGIGISAVDEDTLVATRPVAVEQGGMTFTVEALLSDGEHTKIEFKVTGVPGGKAGWGEADGKPTLPADEKAARVGDYPPSPRPAPPAGRPALRDATGREYELSSALHGVGGSPRENVITGTLYFEPLARDLASVELSVPVDYLVPTTLVSGADHMAWTLSIPLAHPAQSGLPQAIRQDSAATVGGITLRVAASAVEDGRTVVLVEGEAPGEARVVSLVANGANAIEDIVLRDGQGRTYKHIPSGSSMTPGNGEVRQSLYFEPLGPLADRLTLSVAAVQVVEEGEAEVTIPLAGLQPDETVTLDRTVMLGGHEVLLKSATLVQRGDETWLYVDVDLGPRVDGRMLSTFNVDTKASSMSSFAAKEGSQMDQFGVELERGQTEAKLRLRYPMVSVQGPWVLHFTVEGIGDKQ